MHTRAVFLIAFLSVAALASPTLRAGGQDRPGPAGQIVGEWLLVNELSDDPRQNPPPGVDGRAQSDRPPAAPPGGGFGGGFGGFGGFPGQGGFGGGPGGQSGDRERSPEDLEAMREAVIRLLESPERLTIVEASGVLLFTDGDGFTRRLNPDGRKRDQKAANGLVSLERKTEWKGSALVSEIDIEDGPDIVVTYGRSEGGSQLVVTARMKPRRGDPVEIRYVYDPADLGLL